MDRISNFIMDFCGHRWDFRQWRTPRMRNFLESPILKVIRPCAERVWPRQTLCTQNFHWVLFYCAGEPSKDPTHIDFIPTMFSFTPSSVKKSNEQLVQKHERMTQIKLKWLRSIDKEREQVGCSSDILPDGELEFIATAPESCLEQTGTIMKMNH